MDSFDIMFLISVCVCLPLTMAVSCWVCFVVQREQVPITYYRNLLISNLIQFSGMIIIFIMNGNHELVLYHYISLGIFCCAVIANLNFKMCIATERCLVITRPQWNCIRQIKGSVLLSVLVWILSIITGFLVAFFNMIFLPELIFFALLPFFLFVLTLVWTLKTLPAATSVPTEEKERIVGTLVLLLVNHCLMFLPLIIFYIVPISLYFLVHIPIFLIFVNIFLFSPSMDVILVFVMWKDPIDNQLLSLCCYTAGEVAADKKLQLHCCSECNSTVLYTTLQQM
ncbi:carboxypeptidase N regulatory subunit [Sarotherodon galilaeus]